MREKLANIALAASLLLASQIHAPRPVSAEQAPGNQTETNGKNPRKEKKKNYKTPVTHPAPIVTPELPKPLPNLHINEARASSAKETRISSEKTVPFSVNGSIPLTPNFLAVAFMFSNTEQADILPSRRAPFIDGLLFTNPGSVKAFLRESTLEKVNISGTVVDNVVISSRKPTTSCWEPEMNIWKQEIEDTLRARGINPRNFSARIAFTPHNLPICNFGGHADWTNNWIMMVNTTYVDDVAHEIGHLLGKPHGGDKNCNVSIDGDDRNCYLDQTTFMGLALARLNGPQLASYLGGSNKTDVQWGRNTVLALNGLYDNTDNLKLVRIINPDRDKPDEYISNRKRGGIDDNLFDNLVGTAVHYWRTGIYEPTRYETTLKRGDSVRTESGAVIKSVLQDIDKSVVSISFDGKDPVAEACRPGILDTRVEENNSGYSVSVSLKGSLPGNTMKQIIFDSLNNARVVIDGVEITRPGSRVLASNGVQFQVNRLQSGPSTISFRTEDQFCGITPSFAGIGR